MDTLQKNDNGNRNQKPVIRYLLYLLLIVVVVAGSALSRYTSTLAGRDFARAAAFAYEVTVEKNQKDPEVEGNSENKGRVFTDGSFSSVGSSSGVEFEASIYATTKLQLLDKEDEAEFNDVARVIDVEFSNKSEIMVDALIEGMTETDKQENGIVWCLFNEGELDSKKTIYDNVLNQLGYDSRAEVPDDYDALKVEIQSKNVSTLTRWNNSAALEPNTGTKTLTVVVWAEHEGVENYIGWDFTDVNSLDQKMKIDFAVTQVD